MYCINELGLLVVIDPLGKSKMQYEVYGIWESISNPPHYGLLHTGAPSNNILAPRNNVLTLNLNNVVRAFNK